MIELAQLRQVTQERIGHDLTETFGIHYTDPFTVPPDEHRVDFCVSYPGPVPANEEGVVAKVIPNLRCALARHHGSRAFNSTARYLM
jgi:AraC family transcriptional regulator